MSIRFCGFLPLSERRLEEDIGGGGGAAGGRPAFFSRCFERSQLEDIGGDRAADWFEGELVAGAGITWWCVLLSSDFNMCLLWTHAAAAAAAVVVSCWTHSVCCSSDNWSRTDAPEPVGALLWSSLCRSVCGGDRTTSGHVLQSFNTTIYCTLYKRAYWPHIDPNPVTVKISSVQRPRFTFVG